MTDRNVTEKHLTIGIRQKKIDPRNFVGETIDNRNLTE